MKNLYLFLILFMSYSIQSQEAVKFDNFNALKISPVAMGQSEFQFTYERYFKDRNTSLSIIPSVILRETNDETKAGWQIMTQYRFYLNHINKNEKKTFLNFYNYGFYSGVYAQYLDYHEDYLRGYYDEMRQNWINEEFEKDVTAYEGGAIVGIQVDITNRILLDFFVGGGIRYTDIVDTYEDSPQFEDYYDYYDVFDVEYQGVKPKIGFQIGICF